VIGRRRWNAKAPSYPPRRGPPLPNMTTPLAKVVIDLMPRLERWGGLLSVLARRSRQGFVYADNHYAGHGPETARDSNPA